MRAPHARFSKISRFRTVSLANFVRPRRAATPCGTPPSIYHAGTAKSASSRHVTPLMTWRGEARFFISSPSSPLFDSKVCALHHKTTRSAPSEFVARLLPTRFTTAPHSTLPTPSNSRSSHPLRAVVASVRDGGPFWRAPSSHRKYKNHPAI